MKINRFADAYSDNGRAGERLRRHGWLQSGLQAEHTRRLPALPRSLPFRGWQVDDIARVVAGTDAEERKEGKHLRSPEQAATCKDRPTHPTLGRTERGGSY